MRLKMVELENYGGIMNGMGLSKISIDFTKCNHSMLVIKGDNGSGKSTLFKALKPLPDDSDSFIQGLPAKKIISYMGPMGEIYTLTFIHDVKTNGDRMNAKGYITKDIGAGPVELNPTGNITSCKDIIYSEFKLDPNFVALSQLSTDDRGLADKKPAERKKFVNSIISSVEVYNNIYKTLAKRSSIFKSMINSIVSKIDTIGDINELNPMLSSIERTIVNYEASRDEFNRTIAKNESIIESLNGHDSLARKVELETRLREVESTISNLTGHIHEVIPADTTPEEHLELLKLKYRDMRHHREDSCFKLMEIEQSIKDTNTKLQDKQAKLDSFTSDTNYDQLESAIENVKKSIKECEAVFAEMGLEGDVILSKDEYIIGIHTLEQIKEAVEAFQDAFTDGVVDLIVKNIDSPNPDIESLNNCIEQSKYKIKALEVELTESIVYAKRVAILNSRPKECKLDNCFFIADAIEAEKHLKENPPVKIDEAIKLEKENLHELELELSTKLQIIDGKNMLNRIFRMIESARPILAKLPVKDILLEKSQFVIRIISRVPLKEIDVLKMYLQKANVFEDYAYAKNMLTSLEAEYKIYLSKKDIIDTLVDDVNKLNGDLKGLLQAQFKVKDTILHYNDMELDMSNDIKNVENLISTCVKSLNESIALKEKLTTEYDNISKNMVAVTNAASMIEVTRQNLANVLTNLNEKYKERDTVKHKVEMLKEYEKELEDYKASYTKIETIKYYSSPTTGIQTVFMELYMNKIIQLANRLLAMMFDGVFHLDPFIINENEFRIPCSGGNLPHDDISSMSSSQVACISMILSFALLFQSSSKLNILKLDEIDGALDSYNRRNFIIMLDQMLEVLDCQQCIIISHNDEINLDNCDVILLKHSNIEPIVGNIIWKY